MYQVWINNGTPKTFLKKETEKIEIVIKESEFDYIMTRKYFKHKLNDNVTKTVLFVNKKDRSLIQVAFLQYIFKCGPVASSSLKTCHGNSINNKNHFSRMFGTTKSLISHTSISKNELVSQIISERGGLQNVDNPAELPHSFKQMNYWRSKLNLKEDELLCLFEKAFSEVTCIKKLEIYPELRVVLFNNQQKVNLNRFCMDGGSVLGIDTTFNIREFLVTLTTYRHMLLIDSRSGESPVMIGPAYVHQKKSKESFFIFHLA